MSEEGFATKEFDLTDESSSGAKGGVEHSRNESGDPNSSNPEGATVKPAPVLKRLRVAPYNPAGSVTGVDLSGNPASSGGQESHNAAGKELQPHAASAGPVPARISAPKGGILSIRAEGVAKLPNDDARPDRPKVIPHSPRGDAGQSGVLAQRPLDRNSPARAQGVVGPKSPDPSASAGDRGLSRPQTSQPHPREPTIPTAAIPKEVGLTKREVRAAPFIGTSNVTSTGGSIPHSPVVAGGAGGPPSSGGSEKPACALSDVGTPEQLEVHLAKVGYHCMPFYAVQLSLLLNTPSETVKTLLLEGPPGCGKSFLAKSLAKITGAELMCLSCFRGMNLQHLIEQPSTLGMVNAMAGKSAASSEELMQLGIISRAYLKSQSGPVILLIDEIDKVDSAIDTFFLGPIQDSRVWLESRAPIDASTPNLLLVLTKNFERPLGDALLRRVHPMKMTYMSTALEKKVLEPHCDPRIIKNLVRIAEIMRNQDGSYPFERPPAPEELLRSGKYLTNLLSWDLIDFAFVGRNLFHTLAKQDHDRVILEQMLRYHPDFQDPLVPDNRNASMDEIYARLGRILLSEIVSDPDVEKRKKAYRPEKIGLTNVDNPSELIRRLGAVSYQCDTFLGAQITLLLSSPTDRVRSVVLEGPSGCGKSYLAKSLAKATGAELMCLSCYAGMNTAHLIEVPSALNLARSMDGTGEETPKEKLMNLGILSRAFLKSQSQPVVLLVDEIDKAEKSIDTFFLGPIQDGRIWLESRPPIDANLDNLLVMFTKNFNRVLDDALLRRLLPIKMEYLDSALERKVLSNHCLPQLVSNLVAVADMMRSSEGAYQFERPPAPEELVTAGKYILKLIQWNQADFGWIGRNVWAILAKSEHDRAVLEHMLRYHPDFMDPLVLDGKNAHIEQIYARLGRFVLTSIVDDPEADRRERAWMDMEYA